VCCTIASKVIDTSTTTRESQKVLMNLSRDIYYDNENTLTGNGSIAQWQTRYIS